jgi:hypothetical protein
MEKRKPHLLRSFEREAHDTGTENLSPCLIASKAAGMQEAWDKAREAA